MAPVRGALQAVAQDEVHYGCTRSKLSRRGAGHPIDDTMDTPDSERSSKSLSLVACFWHAAAVLAGLPVLWLLQAHSDNASATKSLGFFWALAWMAWPLWWPICLVAGRKRIGATAKALLVPSAMWALVAGFFVWAILHLPIL